MSRRLLPLLLLPALLAGCGHTSLNASAPLVTGQAAARSVRAEAPQDLEQIRTLASNGLLLAAADADWDARYSDTSRALQQINEVALTDKALSNLAARLGILAAKGYGYLGFNPPAEDKYKLQVVVLQYLQGAQTEASFERGTPIFTMAASMLASTSDDQRCKVGISVLAAIRDYYKDPNISRAAGETLKQALQAPDKAACCQTMLDGLKKLGQAAAVRKAKGH